MTLEEFYEACDGYAFSDNPYQLASVLDIVYGIATMFEKPKFLEKKLNGRVLRTLIWLEIIFFADAEKEEITFVGVKPQRMDMKMGANIGEFSFILMPDPADESQGIDWAEIRKACVTFNNHLLYPAAIPFVRVAVDESRGSSLYYPLHKHMYV